MKKYSFFKFDTSSKLASNKGICEGMVNNETGEITATIEYGLTSYSEEYKLNIKNEVNIFPYTIEDRIILNARKSTLN